MLQFANSRTYSRYALLLTLSSCLLLSACVGSQRSDLMVKPISEVDEVPSLVGGVQYIIEELQYPKSAKESNIEGRVLVQFVVSTEGNVRDARIVEGIGHGCDKEALRVMNSAKFTPGKIDGEIVPVQMMIPLQFKLEK